MTKCQTEFLTLLYRSLRFTPVSSKRSRGSKFTKFMADHFFGHKDLHVCLAVMDHECIADKFRHDGTGSGPSLDRFFLADSLLLFNLVKQLHIDKGPFF